MKYCLYRTMMLSLVGYLLYNCDISIMNIGIMLSWNNLMNQNNGECDIDICYKSGTDVARDPQHSSRICPGDPFCLSPQTNCQKFLTCDQLYSTDFEVDTEHLIGEGVVKKVYLARWKGTKVAYNVLKHPIYSTDFSHGLQMLQDLQPTKLVTQVFGSCENAYVTAYHKLGSAADINNVLSKMALYHCLKTRFNLCVKYSEIISFLHNSHIGTRVMCDSNELLKLLSQFLITENLNLVVNDLDALPQVNSETTIKCGNRRISSSFVAPEQLWPYSTEFNDEQMPGYNEKTDIWKIPDVCDFFIGDTKGGDILRFKLYKVHKQCKSLTPSDRPSASDVMAAYIQIFEEMGFTSD